MSSLSCADISSSEAYCLDVSIISRSGSIVEIKDKNLKARKITWPYTVLL